MKKKYFQPVARPSTQDNNNGVSDGKDSRRRLSAKRLIIILSAILVVCVAVVVPVCVVFIDIPVTPVFSDFDQKDDYWLSVTWNNVAAATSYEVEYCFEDPVLQTTKITKGLTTNRKYFIERRAGFVYFRVRAVKGERKGKYSDWIIKQVDPWKLAAPLITINKTTMQVSWTPVSYRFEYDYSNLVPAYVYEYAFQGEGEEIVWIDDKTISTGVRLDSYLLTRSEYHSYEVGEEWPGDITLHFRVAAVNHSYNYLGGFSDSVNQTPAELALSYVYESTGEYAETSLVITQEIFDGLSSK